MYNSCRKKMGFSSSNFFAAGLMAVLAYFVFGYLSGTLFGVNMLGTAGVVGLMSLFTDFIFPREPVSDSILSGYL